MKRSLIWVAVAVVALSALSAVAEAAKPAGTVYVDDDSRCAGLKPCFRTIQRGVDMVGVGGTVNVFPGTYDENVVVDKDITVMAYDATNPPLVDGQGIGATLSVTAAGATLDHLDVVGGLGAGVLVLADTVALQFLDVSGTSGDGIAVTGTSILPLAGESVTSSAASSNTGNGIFIDNVTGVTVNGNAANGNGGYGILVQYSQNAQVTMNSVGGNTLGGILFSNVDPSLIGSNTVTGNGGTGIFVQQSQDIMVQDNDVNSNSNDGIGFNEVDPSYIVNNNVGSNGGTGIMVQSSQEIGVEGNDVQSNSNDGIGFNEVDPSYISNNNVGSNGGTGISVSFSVEITVQGNEVQSNSNDGIGFNEVDPSFILENLISGNGGDGLDLLNSLDILVEENDINGNALGLRLHGGTGNHVFHNNFVGNVVSLLASGSPGVTMHSGCPRPTGNHWSDYTGGDDGTLTTLCGERRVAGDGIGDAGTGHLGLDWYPVLVPNDWDRYDGAMKLDADLEPRTDNDGSKGNWVQVRIRVPDSSGYVADDIDKNTLVLFGNTGSIPWDKKAPSSTSGGPGANTTLHVKFKRQDWVPIVFPGDWCYGIWGEFTDGQTFMATACVHVTDPP